MHDLTSNEQLRHSLLDDCTWWCQRVDHEFEYGNHLDIVPIRSTYQIKLSVEDLQERCVSPGILNSLEFGDPVAVTLPITARRTGGLVSLQVQGSENCTAFIVQPPTNSSSKSSGGYSKLFYVSAIVFAGQVCSITILENRIWKRTKVAKGKESVKQHIPANEALWTTVTVSSAKEMIWIHDLVAENFQSSRDESSIKVATMECCYDLNRIDPLEFEIVLWARLRTGILLFNVLVPIVALVLYVVALVKYMVDDSDGQLVILVLFATLIAVLNQVWISIRQNYFENSFFRIGKL